MTTMVSIFNIIDIEISKVDFINFNLCFFANLTNDTLFDTIINNIFSLSANVYEFKPLKYEEPKNDPPKSENFLSKYTTKETPFGVDKNMDPYSQDPISNKKKRLGVKEIVQGNNYTNKKIKKKSEGLIKFINFLKQRGTRGINSLKRTFEVNCSQQYQTCFSVVSDFCCDRGKESCIICRSDLVFTVSAEV